MARSKGCLLIVGAIVLASLAFTGIKFYGGKYLDRYQRPWAYSTTEPLLVGRWRGEFRDPDGVAKTIEVQIDLPETDDERWTRAGRRSRRKQTDKHSFDGSAIVKSKLGQEDYEIYGAVDRDNDYQFSLKFGTADGTFSITPNFYINDTDKTQNRWQGNEMHLTLRFAYHRPGGSSYSSSADPRFDRVAPLTLTRINP